MSIHETYLVMRDCRQVTCPVYFEKKCLHLQREVVAENPDQARRQGLTDYQNEVVNSGNKPICEKGHTVEYTNGVIFP